MEPDLEVLWADALLKTGVEHDQVLAWLVGTVDWPGHTVRRDQGERDVLLLLRDWLVLVRQDHDQPVQYPQHHVTDIRFSGHHLRFHAFDDESWILWEFDIDADLVDPEPFAQQIEGWQPVEQSSSVGCGVVALVLVGGVLALLYALGPNDSNPVDARLTAHSTCGQFLRAGEDRQLDLLRRLFQEAGRPADAEKPAVLTQSRRRCEENGSVTLDSLVTGR